jgi:DNA-binding MarR family transcriptional regulator
MSQHSPKIEADQLLELSEEVSRIAGSLAKLSVGLGDPKPMVGVHAHCEQFDVAEETVRWLINARNLRQRFMPSDLFADPAWDMLLELYRAEIAHQRIAVSSLCIAANVPATTALRYIKTMVREGMLIREPDRFDGRRIYVSLAPEISRALGSYFVNVVQKPIIRKDVRAQGK